MPRSCSDGPIRRTAPDIAGHDLGADLDVLVLLADVTGPLQGTLGVSLDLGRQLGVERQRQRHLDHVDEVEASRVLPALGLLLLGGSEPAEIEGDAQRALKRASDVGEEYEDVKVSAEVVRARGVLRRRHRRIGPSLQLRGNRDWRSPPTKIKGGAKLGGIGAAKPAPIGAATEYVLKKAPCRVLLTAPPEAAPRAKPPDVKRRAGGAPPRAFVSFSQVLVYCPF